MSAEAELRELLVDLFSADELRRLVSGMEGGRELARALPEGAIAPVELARLLIEVLDRRDRVDDAFFAELRRARPRRAAEIARVEATWKARPRGAAAEPASQPGAAHQGVHVHISGGTFHGVNLVAGGDLRGAALAATATQATAPGPGATPATGRAAADAAEPDPDLPWRPVRVAHLSDLHFKSGQAWDRDPVLRRLTADLRAVREGGLAPDLVVVTGDLASSGQAADYALAADWLYGPLLQAAGVGAEDVLVVAGNHDVDRKKIGRLARAAESQLHGGAGVHGRDLSRKERQDLVAELLQSPDEAALLLARQAAFLDFLNRRPPGGAPLAWPWWRLEREVRGIRLHLAGLNSSWLSGAGPDLGRLVLGSFQINPLLEGAERADLSIALLHHPWRFLAEWDQATSEEEVRRRCGVVLRGHNHDQQTRLSSDPDREVLELAAGAAYSGSDWTNAWQMLELDPLAGRARVHFRRWDGHDWRPDRNLYQTAPEGVATVSLRRSPRAPRRPKAPVAERDDPAPGPAGPRAAYARALRDRADVLARVFRVPDGPSALSKVYVEVRLSGRAEALARDGDALNAAVHRELGALLGGPGGKLPDRPFPLTDVVGLPHRRWAVLGDPGSGKTTLLRHAALELIEGDGPLPVYLKIPELGADARATLERAYGAELAPLALDAIRQGRAVLLLDGLDEAEDPDEALDAVRALCAVGPGNTVVLSSRPIGFREPAPDFARLAICPLGPDEQRALLTAWVREPAAVDRALDRLSRTPRLRRLAENPLLLTLAGLVLREAGDLPRKRAELYDRAVRVLLHKAADPRQPARRLRSPGTALELLCWVALKLHGREGEAYPVRDIVAALRADGRRLAELRAVWGDEERFLVEVAEVTGLLVPDGTDARMARAYTFPHRTFREFLAACALERDLGESAVGLGVEAGREPRERAVAPRPGPWARLLAWLRALLGGRAPGEDGPHEVPPPPGELAAVLAAGRARPERWSEVLALTTGRLGPGGADALVRRVAAEGGEALLLRVVADAEGLSEATVREVLKVEAGWDRWQARRQVLEELPGLVGDLAVAVGLLEQFARATTDGNDLFWTREVLRRIARGEIAGQVLDGTVDDARRAAKTAALGVLDHLDAARRAEATRAVEDLMRPIPAGSFRMGSPEGEGHDDERPRHEVTFDAPFQVMAVPVTWRLYRLFDPGHDAARTDFTQYGGGVAVEDQDELPVYYVTWYAAVMFAEWVGCRLPLEAEWEYACRAGTTSRYWSGQAEADLARVGWYSDNSGRHPHPVGRLPANAWGLHDTHGNVWEWCLDAWDSEAYAKRQAGVVISPKTVSFAVSGAPPVQDPAGLADPDAGRVARGGSWGFTAGRARSAYRSIWVPGLGKRRPGLSAGAARRPSAGALILDH